MASVIHIAEIAAILAVAYMLGWAIGYATHRMLAPKPVAQAAIPEARLAAATGAAEALVKAPVIAPVADPAVEPPAPPVTVEAAAPNGPPEVDVAVAAVEPGPTAAPEPASVRADAPLHSEPLPDVQQSPEAPAPNETPPPVSNARRGFRRFRTAAKGTPAPEPVVDVPPESFTATPATQPGVAWTGEIKGRRTARAAAPEAAPPVEMSAPQVESGSHIPATAAVPEAGTAAEAAPTIEAPASSVESAPSPAPQPEPAPIASPPPVYDEDAAMRAIEGGWSRIKARAMSDTPELSDMGAAVAAATTAVEQVLAKAGIDVDNTGRGARPKGLSRPRNGIKDNLQQIDGLGALDESTLNNLGVYHFDQIANWNDAQVMWMEDHVFARGRIGREDWQRQARELSASTAA